ncbi:MAG TPA: helix-turn-helix domain-containing protein [Candidatus Limnocylindrales bacterium]
MDDDLLPIGRFARLTGLSIGALRHYDEEGVLAPADVDPATGYRRYRRDQVATARAIAALRDLELSLPAIRALLDADDATDRGSILRDERVRLEARTARLQRALHRLSVLAATNPNPDPATKEIPVPTPPPPPELAPELNRALGAGLYNRCWDLMEVEDRTLDQDDELIATAHASAWHWRQVGHVANQSRGHWMCSRVYAVLGRPEPALYHARRCVDIVEGGGEGIEDWDAPSAYEAMARALAIGGDLAGAAEWKAKAAVALQAIAEPEDRTVVEGDLATLPV